MNEVGNIVKVGARVVYIKKGCGVGMQKVTTKVTYPII